MIYAVLDTNVLVSALLSKSSESTINKLMKAVIECKLTPMYSTEIIAEYVEVLSRDKFHFDPELRDAMIARIKKKWH